MLGWPNEGKSYDRIKLSLQRIANVTYNYDNAWWDPRQKSWTTKIFHIIDTVEINDSRASDGQGGLFPSRIVWNEVVFDSFQAGFLRNIDFQLCMRLEHPIALRMYRFLGKRFHHKPDWTLDLKEFAYEHIGLGRNYEGGTQIARKLQPAITELETVGFLETLDDDARFLKKGRDWKIRLIQKAPAADPALPTPSKSERYRADRPRGGTYQPWRDKGQGRRTGREAPGTRLIYLKIDVFDWLMEKQDKRVAKSPAGYLVKSIERRLCRPQGLYLESGTTEAGRKPGRPRKDRPPRIAAASRRRKPAKRPNGRLSIAYWEALTPEQQAELEADVRCQVRSGDSWLWKKGR